MDQRVRRSMSNLENGPISTPILAFPDLSKDATPFILDTEANIHAIGAVLALADQDGRGRVVHYGNRTLDKADRNYNAARREIRRLP